MKTKTILAAVLTALCWISLCLDMDILMYLTGFTALILTGLDDLKVHFRALTKMISKHRSTFTFARKEEVA